MIIKLFLIGALGGVLLYAISQHRRAVLPAFIMAGMSLIGAVFVLYPELANKLARLVGVGRGADLILYCFVVLTLAAILNIHLRLRAERETLTELARAMAIRTATEPGNKG